MISTNIEDIFIEDFDDEFIKSWWRGAKYFIREIEKEIKALELENVKIHERLTKLKEKMDIHYNKLILKDEEFFKRIYSYITLVLENNYEAEGSWYKGIESALAIVEEQIESFETSA